MSGRETPEGRRWDLLALTEAACRAPGSWRAVCGTVLLPGDRGAQTLRRVRAERVVDYGLSPRDTLTLSGVEGGWVVCVQRTLLRPDGGLVEEQELVLPPLALPPEDLLALAGTWLLAGPPGGPPRETFL